MRNTLGRRLMAVSTLVVLACPHTAKAVDTQPLHRSLTVREIPAEGVPLG